MWVGYGWLHRLAYPRIVLGVAGLVALDWGLHALAAFAERPDSNLPSDFAIYSLMLLVGASVGLGAALVYARWTGLSVTKTIDAALVCVIAGGVGARAYHVLSHWEYYAENQAAIGDLAQGGMGIRGGLLSGLLGLLVWAFITCAPFWKLADVGAVGLAIAASIGWYGAYLTHMHYGVPSEAWYAIELPDQYGLLALRVPVQLWASMFYGALFAVLLGTYAARRPPAGALFVWYLLFSSAAGFVFGFWRGDETWRWQGWRVDQWVDVVLFACGAILALLRAAYWQRKITRR